MTTAFFRLCITLGSNIFLGCNRYYKSFFAIPYVGSDIVFWLWGGFAVDNATLTRFFALHFLLPFAILGSTILHLLFLHETGSNNPLGINRDGEKIPFHSYYRFKDLVGFVILLFFLSSLVLFSPQLLTDPE